MKLEVVTTVAKLVIEAAAIAAYESHIRSNVSQYVFSKDFNSWEELLPEVREYWRNTVIDLAQES